jgi:hypothetical protein
MNLVQSQSETQAYNKQHRMTAEKLKINSAGILIVYFPIPIYRAGIVHLNQSRLESSGPGD